MARHRPRRSESHAGVNAGIVGLIVVIAVLVAGYAYFRWQASQRVELDQATNCPVAGPGSVTAVLLDLTDAASGPTLQDLKNKFDELIVKTPEGARLAIYGLTERRGELVQMFDACNPGDGSNVDSVTSNPRRARQRWEEGYRAPLNEFVSDLGSQGSAAQSPIMAGIQKIKLALFDSARVGDVPKTLIVVSDMIEHTDIYSQYRSGFEYESFENSTSQEIFRTSLRGVDVRILFIERLDVPGNSIDRLNNFWTKWFLANGASDVRVVRLEGAN